MNAAQALLQAWLPPARLPPAPRTTTVFNRVIPVPNGAVLPQPAEYPYVVKDKLGDPRMIWRGTPLRGTYWYDGEGLRRARAYHGVGRPPSEDQYVVTSPSFATALKDAMFHPDEEYPDAHYYADMVEEHGSQRKAAAALGISLGKLQRGLRKWGR